MKWELVENITESDGKEWEKLIHFSLGENVHSGRKKGFCLAREALRLSLRKMGKDLQISETILKNFHSTEKFPDITLSLSHTAQVGVALVAEKAKIRSLGIDVEPLERNVKPEILKRISNQNDLSLSAIEIWCLKEAAFKALMNTDQFSKNLEFSDIVIHGDKFSHPPSGMEGRWELETIRPFVVARAWIAS
jgi:4'-phosphopantetheinyl transferase EntD